jgi:hypothetical protein
MPVWDERLTEKIPADAGLGSPSILLAKTRHILQEISGKVKCAVL